VSSGQQAVEDEVHFLIQCPEYNSLREETLARIDVPGFSNYNENERFRFLLTSQPHLHLVGQFIIKAFDKRTNL
jgi:hypothetical protein